MNCQALRCLQRKVLDQLVHHQSIYSVRNIPQAISPTATDLVQSVQQQVSPNSLSNSNSPPAVSPTEILPQHSVQHQQSSINQGTSIVLQRSVEQQQSINQTNSNNPSAVIPSECSFHVRLLSIFLIFVVPSIMLYSSEISPTRCNNCVFILLNGFTLRVSGDSLTHHQEYICCIWPQVSRLT